MTTHADTSTWNLTRFYYTHGLHMQQKLLGIASTCTVETSRSHETME